MQVVLDEARESQDVDIGQELPSNTKEEMEANVNRCRMWAEQWVKDNA